jgi:glycosyltransferase involved in cell wall biosynthesis
MNEPYIPEVIGGGLLDIHHRNLFLLEKGHQVEVVAGLARDGHLPYLVRQKVASGRLLRTVTDSVNGYPTHRAASWMVRQLLEWRLAEFAPDMVVVQGKDRERLARIAVDGGVPTCIRLITHTCVDSFSEAVRDAPEVGELVRNPLVTVLSNSLFVRNRLRERSGLDSDVDYPFIAIDDCVAPERRPEHVTFFNPVAEKGVDIALGVAGLLPHRTFLFVEGWPLGRKGEKSLRKRLEVLPNVQLERKSSSVAGFYGSTALLLVPSQWEEALGRVVLEALANGIPVVGSRIGGIPEGLADGGILVPASDPPERWAEAVERVLSDPDTYAQLSANARACARRPEYHSANIGAHFLDLMKERTLR